MKKLLLILLLLSNTVYAQITPNFPKDIERYQKYDDLSLENKKTQLQLVLFDKDLFKKLSLNNNDLILDAQDLNKKVSDFFKPIIEKVIQEKNKKGKKITKTISEEKETIKGFLLITKYIFLGKDKPYKIENNEDNIDLNNQIYKESQCSEGICVSHIIMGINYFDESLNIKALDIHDFTKKVAFKETSIIHGNYETSQEGILKIYYFYGINGSILEQDKKSIKKLIQESQK